ncbi:coniferyl aldehyde dehydrogenase [Marinobacterium sediminicola]|uniref:Aldehyde dehydrogenase n=1 Tax=Marinobacterium sediminicola TaxID=518898 RepID=A0ABY1S434_9GAMM|nr:coniferyl aldehyde dehydrogenase [Marinobacterium sediminicola]ULG70132.1 coniferyl aldehyde dehydrogenase [Marinobacterium sediminicola]SMR78407.1 coniferyl-aldehyde dehydrogenase [Marinobacterium sediminicola]
MAAAVTTPAGIHALLDVQQQAFNREGAVSAETRKARIQQVIDLLVDHCDALADAMGADFGEGTSGGRPRAFSIMNDVLGSLGSLKHARDHLEEWMKADPRKPFVPYDQLGGQAEVLHQPKGSVGIIGTWNAPLFTLFSPLACALAAGNRAILKPSEVVPQTAALVAELVSAHLDPEIVGVAVGDAEIGAAFASSPFNHLVFTGSTAVGRKIMRAAAENLVPVTLELGGKSPVIMGRSADLDDACRRLAIAKGTNGGQICISPDILYVLADKLESVITSLKEHFCQFYPTVDDNPDLVAAVNDSHLQRVESYLTDARERGVRIESSHPEASGTTRKRPLRLVINPPADSLVMQEEIFGSALVVKPYEELDQAIEDIHGRGRPLALYYFGWDADEEEKVLSNTLSGGVTVNDLMMHAAMHEAPFGGVGASGMGHYHGYEGFLEFSHARTVFRAPQYDPRGEWGMLPPHHDQFEAMMRAQVTKD